MPKATDKPTKIRDQGIRIDLRLDRGEELGIRGDPAVRLHGRRSLDPPGDDFRRIDVLDRHVDGRNAADHAEKRLSRPQRDEAGTLIDTLVAEIDQTGNRQHSIGAGRGLQVQLVADGSSEILGEFGADDDVLTGQTRLAGRDVVRHLDDVEIRFRFDPCQRHRPAGVATYGQNRSGDGRRDRGDFGHGEHLAADLRPLVDRDHPLARTLHCSILDLPGGIAQGTRHLIRREELDWGWEVSTRLIKFASRPASIADMKTITPTPIEMPPTMKMVCNLPSRRNRTAAIHSNGSQWFMAGRGARAAR